MIVPTIVAVVPAAGIGSRMQIDKPKQYLTIGNRTILEHTLLALHSHPLVSRVVVALHPEDNYFRNLPLSKAHWISTVNGGASRADSVLNALKDLAPDEWALVHDAARPCLTVADIDKLVNAFSRADFQGGILATPVRDTMKRARHTSAGTAISHTESREDLWHALTPQLFRASDLRAAIAKATNNGIVVTDEASAMEYAGYNVALINGNPANIKVTHPADVSLATFYLQQGGQS